MIFKTGDITHIIHCKSRLLGHILELTRWKVMLYMPGSLRLQFQHRDLEHRDWLKDTSTYNNEALFTYVYTKDDLFDQELFAGLLDCHACPEPLDCTPRVAVYVALTSHRSLILNMLERKRPLGIYILLGDTDAWHRIVPGKARSRGIFGGVEIQDHHAVIPSRTRKFPCRGSFIAVTYVTCEFT
jgi:hypothetical protein